MSPFLKETEKGRLFSVLTGEKKKQGSDYAVCVVMALAMALNYEIFILSNAFAPAGLNGLATMVQYLFHFSVGYMSLLINIPLAVFTFFAVDRRFALKTLVFSLTFSFALLFLQKLDLTRFIYHTRDGKSTLLAPVVSGVINGAIYGVTIRRGGSTGGTDFVAAYVHKKRPEYSLVHVIFALNTAVAVLSYFVYDFNIEPVILCIVYCFITSRVSDDMLKAGQQAIRAEIVTPHAEEVADCLLRELRHGVTILPAVGGYSHRTKSMLICVINKHQITQFSELMRQFPDTFVCVSNVTETLGNFKKVSR